MSSKDITGAIDGHARRARVAERLTGGKPPREFAIDLTPNSTASQVYLDGVDIGGLLTGISIKSGVGVPTCVKLDVAHGQRAIVRAKVPEAQVVMQVAGSDYGLGSLQEMVMRVAKRDGLIVTEQFARNLSTAILSGFIDDGD